jgi:hypothetical protein
MTRIFIAASLTSLVSLSGCAKDYSLAPPPASEHVTVTVKVPDELVAETIEVVYRSTLCASMRYTAIGTSYQRDGVQRINITPVRLGASDIYEAQLPRDGGGACQWRLSNVTFGVIYSDPTRFGKNVTYGAGGGVVVIFDNNNSPRGGADFKVDGDLTIKHDYYPWLSEAFLGGYRKQVSLEGGGYINLMYKALQARRIDFEPVLHSGFVVRSEGTKIHKVGNYIKFIYPDGTTKADGRSQPDYRKLQSIRLNPEGMQ